MFKKTIEKVNLIKKKTLGAWYEFKNMPLMGKLVTIFYVILLLVYIRISFWFPKTWSLTLVIFSLIILYNNKKTFDYNKSYIVFPSFNWNVYYEGKLLYRFFLWQEIVSYNLFASFLGTESFQILKSICRLIVTLNLAFYFLKNANLNFSFWVALTFYLIYLLIIFYHKIRSKVEIFFPNYFKYRSKVFNIFELKEITYYFENYCYKPFETENLTLFCIVTTFLILTIRICWLNPIILNTIINFYIQAKPFFCKSLTKLNLIIFELWI